MEIKRGGRPKKHIDASIALGLVEQGMTRKKVAKELGVSYQFLWRELRKARREKEDQEAQDNALQIPSSIEKQV